VPKFKNDSLKSVQHLIIPPRHRVFGKFLFRSAAEWAFNMANINFYRQVNGYDPSQVDLYIDSLSNEYKKLYEQYAVVKRQLEAAQRESALKAAAQPVYPPSYGAPAAVNYGQTGQAQSYDMPQQNPAMNRYLEAEALYRHVVSQAQTESDRIVSGAKSELEHIYFEKQQLLNELNGIAERVKAITGRQG
jgi:cell division septum initiation protein DivIVA